MRPLFLALLLSLIAGPAAAPSGGAGNVLRPPSAPVAPAAQDDLQPLAAALDAVRSTQGANTERDAGPELTPVKQALRAWVERQLPPVPAPNADGVVDELGPDDLGALAATLNRRLDAAKLRCGDRPWESPECARDPKASEDFRGHVEGVRLGTLDAGRYLLVVTGVGIACGFDQSFYLYEAGSDRKWRLLLASEQDRYAKGDYEPQNFLSIDVSPSNAGWGEPAPPPLVVTLGYSPWCSSNWQMLYTRLWRASRAATTPRPLIDRKDELYRGDDFIAAARLGDGDLLMEFNAASIDDAELVRRHVVHYRIGPGDRLERTAPVAFYPGDFVQEWLTSERADAARWIDPRANRAALARIHGLYAGRRLLGEFDGPAKNCRSDPSLWQVGFAEHQTGGVDGRPRYFQVRWTPPYRFTLVRAESRPFRGCDWAVAMPDNVGTLFAQEGWTP